MQIDGTVQLSQLVGMVRRRLGLIAAVAASVFLLSIVVAGVLPNVYEATTTLLVEPQAVSRKLVDGGLEETDLNARLHLMTMQILSRTRLSRVIDELGLYEKESREMTREEVIGLMREKISVEPVLPEMAVEDSRSRPANMEINTFQLHFQHGSAKNAADVANRLANDFIEEHIRDRVQVSGDTSEFLERELESLSGGIGRVEASIASVKNENTGSLPEDMDANQEMLERVVGDLRLAQRDLAIAESDEAFYRQQALTGATDRRDSGRPDTPAERTQRLQILLGEFRSRGYTEKHPDVVAAEEELALLEEMIAGNEAVEDAETAASVSPAQALATNEESRAAIRAEAARREIERLTSQGDELRQRLARTPMVAEQLQALEREHRHLFDSYQSYSGKRLEASVAANMELRQKGEQFRVLEAAFVPPEPISPNRPLILAVGLLLGLALGAGLAVGLESIDSSMRSAREAQWALRVPVLAEIPEVVLASDRARRRRRRMLQLTAAAAISGVVLAGAGAGYFAINGVSDAAEAESEEAETE